MNGSTKRKRKRAPKPFDLAENPCPHCEAGEASVWDNMFECYAHPDLEHPGKLKMCEHPWRAREVM